MKKILEYAVCLPVAVLSVIACNKNEEKVINPSVDNNVVLEFAVSDVKSTSAVIDVTPAKDTVSYYWSVMPSEDYSALDGTEALWDRDMSRFNELAAERGVSVEEIIAEETVRGGVKETVTGLMPETEYVAYGYGLSVSETSNVVSLEHFTTSKEGAADNPARVTVEIGDALIIHLGAVKGDVGPGQQKPGQHARSAAHFQHVASAGERLGNPLRNAGVRQEMLSQRFFGSYFLHIVAAVPRPVSLLHIIPPTGRNRPGRRRPAAASCGRGHRRTALRTAPWRESGRAGW